MKNSLNRAQIKVPDVKSNDKMEYKCSGRQEPGKEDLFKSREGSSAKRDYTTLEGKII